MTHKGLPADMAHYGIKELLLPIGQINLHFKINLSLSERCGTSFTAAQKQVLNTSFAASVSIKY
ncbi:MAG: hypothetical protein C0594_12815 [Marinilabiliales bacterium]|nr:MAG: hypothetical protein C0594_12815 [Marinilabiliales bacterium]